jgi:hypothetical protein
MRSTNKGGDVWSEYSADGMVLAYAAADYSIGLLDARTLAVSMTSGMTVLAQRNGRPI